MNQVFVISTPTQAYFLSKTPHLVKTNSQLIILKSQNSQVKSIKNHLGNIKWAKIRVWDIKNINLFKNYYKVIQFRILLSKFKIENGFPEEICIGSYDNLFQLAFVGEFEKYSRITLLYDGLQIAKVAKARKFTDSSNHVRSFNWIFRLAGLKRPKITKLTFVSPIHLTTSNQDKIIYIRKDKECHNPNLNKKEVHIVGQPLLDMGILSEKNFIFFLEKMKEYYMNHNISYIIHPKESIYAQKIISQYFTMKLFDKIYEEEYLNSKVFPFHIASFYSSVLINMNYLGFKGDIVAFKIPYDMIEKESLRITISEIYNYFDELGTDNFLIK